jgi:hypothetical protein
MNEEITKILQMLEAGKINAAEAERLIDALKDASTSKSPDAESESQTFPNPFRDLQELLKVFTDAQGRAMRRQNRWLYWRHYKHARSEFEARAKRAETMDTEARVRYILTERVLVDKRDFDAGASLNDLLNVSRWCCERTNSIAWDNLRYGLEDEFSLELSMEDLKACETVQALVDFVAARVPAPVIKTAPVESTADEGEPVARRPKTSRHGPAAPQPAG